MFHPSVSDGFDGGSMINLSLYIGLTLKKAQDKANQENLKHRIVSVDRVSRVVTCDYKPTRLNFYIENNIIKKVTLG